MAQNSASLTFIFPFEAIPKNLYTFFTLFINLTSNIILSFGMTGFLNYALLTLMNNTDFLSYSVKLSESIIPAA